MDKPQEMPVIVGVDGSEPSLRAVDWAAAEALDRDCPLRIIHAFIWPLMRVPPGPGGVRLGLDGLRADAEQVLETAVRRAKAVAPGVSVVSGMPAGAPAPVLIEASKKGSLVVVGSTGLGELTGLLIGSTGVHLAAHAQCPVVVVRGTESGDGEAGRVVAGVDDDPSAAKVLELALVEGARLRTPVVVLHVVPGVADQMPRLPETLATMLDRWSSSVPAAGADSPDCCWVR